MNQHVQVVECAIDNNAQDFRFMHKILQNVTMPFKRQKQAFNF